MRTTLRVPLTQAGWLSLERSINSAGEAAEEEEEEPSSTARGHINAVTMEIRAGVPQK